MRFVPDTVSRFAGRTTLRFQKNQPHIFFAVGLVGSVTSTVMACRATMRLPETLETAKKNVEAATDPVLPEKELERAKARAYLGGAYSVGRLYLPATVVGVTSLALLTASHTTLTKRNNALAATVMGLTRALDEYRARVREELGEERERDLYYGIMTEKVGKGENAQIVKTRDPNAWSIYARWFDEASPNWRKNAEYNMIFLRVQQEYFTNLLTSRGHVFLNEVYDALGIPRSQAGNVVGWFRGFGDAFVDLGIMEVHQAPFVNGNERSLLLDFNVYGPILNLL